MTENKWSISILLRYGLLQLPAIALLALILLFIQRWVDLPGWIFWGALGAWALKDALLYPFVWRAYDWGRSGAGEAMVGAPGTAKEPIDPSGYVQVRGELWRAQLAEGSPPIEKGQTVRVRDVRGLTLVVEPDHGKAEKG